VSIDPGIPVPAYRQLADILRARIESGELTDRIPSEVGLSQEYGVAVTTVRHALALLREEGLIERVPGLGTFVRRKPGKGSRT
jgi:GntR family transcriptional regulator